MKALTKAISMSSDGGFAGFYGSEMTGSNYSGETVTSRRANTSAAAPQNTAIWHRAAAVISQISQPGGSSWNFSRKSNSHATGKNFHPGRKPSVSSAAGRKRM